VKYALSLSFIGAGAVLIFAGFKGVSAWDIVRSSVSDGAPTREYPAINAQGGTDVGGMYGPPAPAPSTAGAGGGGAARPN